MEEDDGRTIGRAVLCVAHVQHAGVYVLQAAE